MAASDASINFMKVKFFTAEEISGTPFVRMAQQCCPLTATSTIMLLRQPMADKYVLA